MKKSLFHFAALSFFTLSLLFSSCKSSSALFSKGAAPAASYVDSVAFELTSNVNIVAVEIEGETYRFLFDTGAPMVISEALQKKLNCKVLVNRKVTGSSGQSNIQPYVKMPAIKVGQHNFNDLTAVVLDLKFSPVIGCLNIDGIIGANLMRHAIWKIDYEKQKLFFTNIDTLFQPHADSHILPFRTKATYTPVVNVKLDTVWLKNITFDTGSGNMLSLGKTYLPDYIFENAPKKTDFGHGSSGVYGSVIDTNYALLNNIVAGGSTADTVVVNVSKNSTKKLLGNRYFQQFDVIMNWQESKMYLHKKSAFNPKNSVGFWPQFEDDKLIVAGVYLNSAPAKNGLALNDKIVSFNGIDCREMTLEKFCEVLDFMRNKNQPITVEIAEKGAFTFDWEPLF